MPRVKIAVYVIAALAAGLQGIIVSGHRPSMRALEQHGIPYLPKPFAIAELVRAIRGLA